MKKEFSIDKKLAGERLDKFISDRLELSRSQSWRLLEQNLISLNNKKINKSFKGYTLKENDSLTIAEFRTAQDLIIRANNKLKLKIIADKENYIVINKEAGMNIMPKTEKEHDTVLNALLAKYPQIQGIGEAGLRSGVVHRLDKDTSGVLIVAKSQSKWQSLRQAFKEHKSQKIYHAIVAGEIAKQGKEKMYLQVAKSKPAKVKIAKNSNQAWLCDLTWQRLESFSEYSLIEISLGTGFLHQIRVMMADLGHYVLGDLLYGSTSSLAVRQMLHAKSIRIDGIAVEAEYPTDFAETLAKLL